jgi:hypothetical protein
MKKNVKFLRSENLLYLQINNKKQILSKHLILTLVVNQNNLLHRLFIIKVMDKCKFHNSDWLTQTFIMKSKIKIKTKHLKITLVMTMSVMEEDRFWAWKMQLKSLKGREVFINNKSTWNSTLHVHLSTTLPSNNKQHN